jgi:uncharacterized protein (DUF3084 family)
MIIGKDNCFESVLEADDLFEGIQKRQDELIKQKEAEEAKERERLEQERLEQEAELERQKQEEEERERRENSWWNKLKKNVTKLGTTIFSDED